MFAKKATASPAIDGAVLQGVSYELTLVDRMRRSERRAWLAAWCAIAMSLILAGGYFLFLPLKEKVPYLVMADPYTGTATVARLVGNFHDRDVTTEEAINKSNVAQFVLAREAYDSGLIGQRNWRTTLSMADPSVAPAYIALHSENNPERPARIYGSARAMRVRILSIVLIGGGQGRRPAGATVRFQRSVYDKARGRSESPEGRIATLEFTYDQDLLLSEEDRLLNPLGFRVTNYRVDNDYAAAPEPERAYPLPVGMDTAEATTAPEGTAAMRPETVPPGLPTPAIAKTVDALEVEAQMAPAPRQTHVADTD